MKERQLGTTTRAKNTVKQAFISSLPVMAGYIVLGMGFGILLQDKGYTWPWALLMGVTIYAGSMQYVAVDLLAAGASLISVVLMTVMVQIRHLFYGITLLKKYEKAGKYKPYMIFGLTDETYSLVSRPELPENVDEFKYYFYLTMMNHSYWIIGDVLGVVVGSSFAFNSAGVDFAMTALFVVIFVEQWESAKSHLPAITGIVITAICRLLFDADTFLIPSMIGITAALFLEKRQLEKVLPVDDETAETAAEAETADGMKMTETEGKNHD